MNCEQCDKMKLLDRLQYAIHNGSSLAELRHMIGPTEDQKEASRQRVEQLDRIWDRYTKEHGTDRSLWPPHAQDRYDQLSKEQDKFEGEYC